ncbi:MAG: response regulator transcription factor [Prochlorococcaceae cyanobacterium]
MVEDQVIFLQLLVALLRSHTGLDVVATAGTVADGTAACLELSPDLLILDLALPDGEGTAVMSALQGQDPMPRVIVLSGQASSFVCPAQLQPMLHAVIDKTRAYDVLLQEVACLQGGERDGGLKARLQSLTPRERQIFSLIGQGGSSREIAEALQLSPYTVETHRKKIAAKIGVSGLELVRLASMELPSS